MASTFSPLAVCSHCGTTIRMAMDFGANVNVVFRGSMTRCSGCGQLTSLDQVIQIARDGAVTVETPQPALREAYARLFEELQAKDPDTVDPAELLDQIEALNPALAVVLRPVARNYPLLLFLAVVFMALSRCSLNLDVDVNELVKQASREPAAEAPPASEPARRAIPKGPPPTPPQPLLRTRTKRQRRRVRGRLKRSPR